MLLIDMIYIYIYIHFPHGIYIYILQFSCHDVSKPVFMPFEAICNDRLLAPQGS